MAAGGKDIPDAKIVVMTTVLYLYKTVKAAEAAAGPLSFIPLLPE
jgi:hypothetical protein